MFCFVDMYCWYRFVLLYVLLVWISGADLVLKFSASDIGLIDRDGLEAVLSRQRQRSRQSGQGSNVLNRGKAEAESSRLRRGRLNSRQGRGDP